MGLLDRLLRRSPAVAVNAKAQQEIESPEAYFATVTKGQQVSSLARYGSQIGEELDPRNIHSAHRQADMGNPRLQSDIYHTAILRDAHLGGVDSSRRADIANKPLRVHALNESPLAQALAKFVETSVGEIDSFDQSIWDLLAANPYGYAISEVSYGFKSIRVADRAGKYVVSLILLAKKIDWVHPRCFVFDPISDEPLLQIDGGGVRLPRGKFVKHYAVGTGLVEQRGYMRACIWLAAFKSWAIRDWIMAAHLFGLPSIQGVFDADRKLSDAERVGYQSILENLGQGYPALHSSNFDIKITPPPPVGKATDMHGALIGMANAEMSKRILHSTLTAELGGVGSYNASETHADMRHAIVQADARKLATTLRDDLVFPLIELNMTRLQEIMGATEQEILANVPTLSWRVDRETSPEVRARIISMALNEWGLEISAEQQRAEFGIDAPRPGTDALHGNSKQKIQVEEAKAEAQGQAAAAHEAPVGKPAPQGNKDEE